MLCFLGVSFLNQFPQKSADQFEESNQSSILK